VSQSPSSQVSAHGWALFAHPLFLDQVKALADEVEQLRRKDPMGYRSKNATKRLAAVRMLMLDVIPQDPSRPEYRQGSTLGSEHRHWFRAKFFQQYRLFFRFHAASRIIVFGWVNDTQQVQEGHVLEDAPVGRGALLALIRTRRVEIHQAGIRRGIRNVRVFGSAARGDETADSDVDLLVDFDAARKGILPLVGFIDEVQGILGRGVDATTVDLLRDEIRERVEAEAVPL